MSGATGTNWSLLISSYIQTEQINFVDTSRPHPVFLCPDARIDGGYLHYTASHGLFASGLDNVDYTAPLRLDTQIHMSQSSPCVTARAGTTKNDAVARQAINPDLAHALAKYVRTKTPGTTVFPMPAKHELAKMLRSDLGDARAAWTKDAEHDPEEVSRRHESDFLCDVNHDGDRLDFHALRHTTGAWLALAGGHPKTIQTVMRHSTIQLTMDTYGHLIPGQAADAVGLLPVMVPGKPKLGIVSA